MGRPATRSAGPVVAVDVDGRAAAWCDGQFQGDTQIVAEARQCAAFGISITVLGREVRAGAGEPWGALAALFAYRPGRTRVLEAPERLLQELRVPRERMGGQDRV